MSTTALPAALERVRALDPRAADELASAFTRLARAGGALSWAQERLPALLAASTTSAKLEVLVAEGKELTGVPGAWAVTWRGRLGKRMSFEALAGDGGNIPAPAEISKTMVGQVIEEGRPAWSDDALADARFTEAESVQAYGLRSIGCLPLGEQGVLYLHDPREPGRFPLDCRAKLTALCSLAALVLKVDTRTGDKAPQGLEVPGLVGSAPAMVELYEAVHAFAGMPWPALVLGETGTGKEAVARALHSLSDNADGAFVALNCGAIPDELAESTLFGHVKGAFTGADRPRDGLVARAAGGTLFLDEVGELSPRAQLKLLRLLQEGTYNRVGEDRERRVRARVVAATHQPLEEDRETFRDDLYYRLAACVLNVPPLRARSQDVPALAEHLLDKALGELPGAPRLELSDSAAAMLTGRSWEGNVRELENALRGAIGRALGRRSSVLLPEHFRSAKALGVSRQWLYRLLARWEGAESPPFPAALGLEPLSVLGRGSMGWVFRARDPLLERDVAVKIARPDRGEQARDARLLEGGGRLSLSCQVPALARLHRFELRQRRLVPVEVHSLEMPLTRLELEPGPWLIEVGAEGYTTVRYSLALRRQQHHRGEVRLFRPEQVGDGFVHVPASPFHMGGDPVARMLGWRVGGRGPLRSFVVSGDPLARGALESCEPTLGDRFVQETPVTSAAWREFLDDLPLDEARSLVPGEAGLHGKLLPYWEHDGSRWILPEDWDPHWPVMGVSLADEDDLRLASRSGLDPNFRSSFVGFRLVSEEPAPSPSAPMADRA